MADITLNDGKSTAEHREQQHSEVTEKLASHVGRVNLNRNIEAKIQNPLAGLPRSQLLQNVNAFANEHGLTHITPLLERGALLAQNPDGDVTSIPGITPTEAEELQLEKTHKWRHPWALYITIITCSIGAAVQGWDQTGSNGANLSFPQEFGIAAERGEPNFERDRWLVGLVNAAPYIAASILGCWLSDPCNNYFGRRGTIFISAIFCLLTPIGSGVSQNWEQLFICRLLMGIGMGLKGSAVPIFAAENSPARIRGALVMSWQMWVAFGIFLGFCANLAVYRVGDIAWRLQLGSAFIPAVPLCFGIWFCPESPRWYIKKGRVTDAYTSLIKLRNCELQAARDLYYIHAQLQAEREVAALTGEKSNYVKRFIELFTIPRVRRATLASWTVMLAQQMCGINIIAFYSSTIFVESGFSTFSALMASWGFGLVNFIFAFPAFFTIDTFGRRSLLLFTFPNMAWSLLAAGFSTLIPEGSQARIVCVSLFVFIFAAFYSPGEGPVPFTYSAEAFPLSHREVGMSSAVATNLFWASVLSLTFPRMLEAFAPVGAFGFYAGLNVLAFLMLFLWLPETKQRTLEELDYIFAVPTSMHMRYQVTKSLPYFFKRYVFFNKNAKLEPLYQLDKVGVGDDRSRSSTEEGVKEKV